MCIGQSIIRNITSSPFSQRKSSNSQSSSPAPHHLQYQQHEGFRNLAQQHPGVGGNGSLYNTSLQCSSSPLAGRKRIQPSTNMQYGVQLQGNTSPIGTIDIYHLL